MDKKIESEINENLALLEAGRIRWKVRKENLKKIQDFLFDNQIDYFEIEEYSNRDYVMITTVPSIWEIPERIVSNLDEFSNKINK